MASKDRLGEQMFQPSLCQNYSLTKSLNQEDDRIGLQLQKKIIGDLEAEKLEIMANLYVATSSHQEMVDHRTLGTVKKRLDMNNKKDEEISKAKTSLKELDDRIKVVHNKVKSLKTPKRGELESLSRKQKSLSSLEKLLHETNMRCNLTMTKNSKLKGEIVTLMKERLIFLKFYDALMNRLDAGKKVMADLIDEVSLTCDSREDYLNKMETLALRGDYHLSFKVGEMEDLHLQGIYKSRVHEGVELKGQKRVMKSVIEKEEIRRKQLKRTIEATLDEYRKIVGKIQGLTKMKSLAGICELLTKQEEDTHRLYNDVSDTRSTVLHLREQVRESYRKIKLETEKQQLRLDRRKKIGQDLTNELEARTSELRKVHERYQRNQDILNKLMSWMEEMFVLLRCDKAPLLALLGEHSSVSLLNWGMYMRLIERRTLDIINILYCKEGHPSSISGIKRSTPPVIVPPRKARLEVVPLCEAAPTQPCSLCSEEYMLKDEAVGPLSSKQLTTRILQLSEDTSKKSLLHNLCDCSHPESRKLFRDILLSQ